ncbi:hypothetical protein JXC34_04770, partial [Candidatus Woesearchaeota archaeon]|nr:hypothetical protein [Candidatus Woesearchaeota archaeon]
MDAYGNVLFERKREYSTQSPELEKMITSTIEAGKKERFDAFKNKAQRGMGAVTVFLTSFGTGPVIDLGQYIGLINEDAQKSRTVQILDKFRGMTGCKKAPDDEVPQEVTYLFEIVDHMTGQGRTFTKQGYTNTAMTITSAETEISGVVPGYLSIQDPSTGEILG